MKYHHTYRIAFARYPAVRILVCWVGGILLATMLGGSLLFWLVLDSLLLGLYLVFEIYQRKKLDPWCQRTAILAYLLLVIGISTLHTNWRLEPGITAERVRPLLELFTWEQVAFHGEVSEVQPGNERERWTILIDSVTFRDTLSYKAKFKLRARWKADSSSLNRAAVVNLGDYIGFRGTVYPVNSPRNPHQFDYAGYLKQEDISLVAGVDELLYIHPDTTITGWITLRRQVHALIESQFSQASVPLAKAILIGEKSELADPTRKSFARSGLAHIMAVSGMHVGFIVAPLWMLIPWFWRFKWGKWAGLFLIILVLLTYAGITGFSASVTRASLTAVLLAYGKLFHRRRNSINLTATAALILLSFDPRFLFQIGFQLSFGAVFTILIIWPLLNGWINGEKKKQWWQPLLQLFLLSLVVQIGLLPLLAQYFGEISLIGPFMNMVVMVVIGLMVQIGLLGLLVAAWWPFVGGWFIFPVDILLQYLQQIVHAVSDWPLSWISVSGGHPLWIVLWGLMLLALASSHMPRHRWKWWIAVLVVACTWQLDYLHNRWRMSQTLRVTALDVGQGDALVIQTPADKTLLIDAGRWTQNYNSGSSVLIPYLESEGVDTVDAVILTHPHADHIGGMVSLLEQKPVRKIYHPGTNYQSALYQRVKRRAKEGGVAMEAVGAGDQIPLDRSLKIFVMGPPIHTVRSVENINDASIILKMQYGEHGFLFMGDAEHEQERLIGSYYGVGGKSLLSSVYLKVGHHGSNTSSSTSFLRKVQPSVAVTSLALKNRYRHPHPGAVRRLRKWTSDSLLFTSTDHAVVYESDGKNLRLINWDNQQF